MNFFRSVKLSVGLISYLIIFFIAATLIPQNENINFYTDYYGPFAGNIILFLRLNDFSRSAFFLVPGFVFFINLLFCSIHRFSSRIKKKLPLRPGPDIIHLGIMILFIGGFLSSAARQEKMFFLMKGEKLNITDSFDLVLEQFNFEKYADGRPKSWISTVIIKNIEGKQNRYSIEVNKPLKIEKYAFFQESYSGFEALIFKNSRGKSFTIKNKESLKTSAKHIYFQQIKNREALVTVWDNSRDIETKLIKAGDRIDDLTLTEISAGYLSGLKAVYDPGTKFAILSFIVICCGLFVTFYQKRGELKQ
ncbi:MAG: cytochrome c biogenesis protein ResB [Spirochaetota bacterium]